MRAPQTHLRFPHTVLPPSAEELRVEFREFLAREKEAGTWERSRKSWGGWKPGFSKALGEAGYLGLTWPKEYGGGERTYLERYALTEELLAAGAPSGFHWIADRQSGPVILRFGTEEQKQRYLPGIVAGETSFCIGMSEPDSGSDLASVRTRAVRDGDGWRVTGTKIWTSNAHRADYCILFCRTEEPSDKRHAGLSQFIVDLKATEGLTVRPIFNIAGSHDFNEVVFDNSYLPNDCLLGEPGNGWEQVTSELSFERAGPDRFLTNLAVLSDLVGVLGKSASPESARAIGRLFSHLSVLRKASISVAGLLEAGELPNVESAIVKDLGTAFQQELPAIARAVASAERVSDAALLDLIENAILVSPAYTIQGGTTEILRGIIARGLRLR